MKIGVIHMDIEHYMTTIDLMKGEKPSMPLQLFSRLYFYVINILQSRGSYIVGE